MHHRLGGLMTKDKNQRTKADCFFAIAISVFCLLLSVLVFFTFGQKYFLATLLLGLCMLALSSSHCQDDTIKKTTLSDFEHFH